MMRHKLRSAAEDPYFRLTLILGVNGLIDAARNLTSVGIDVNKLVTQALESINLQLNEAAYEITDLDALLEEAQAIGDEVVKKPQEKTGEGPPNSEQEIGD